MIPGTLYFDCNFRFHYGEGGKKILIALGTSQGVTIVVKTTSQHQRFRNNFGCQVDHRFPNFFLTEGCCCLSKPTWVCLDEYYEFKDSEILQRHFSGDINLVGVLSDEITIALAECAMHSKDISYYQLRIIQNAMNRFRSLQA